MKKHFALIFTVILMAVLSVVLSKTAINPFSLHILQAAENATKESAAQDDPVTLLKKGLSMMKQNQFGAAETYFSKAETAAEATGDQKNKGMALAYLDKLYSATGEKTKAVKNLIKLCDMLSGNKKQAVPFYTKTAELAIDTADYDTALKYFALAKEYYTGEGKSPAMASRMDNWTAMAYSGKGEFGSAMDIYSALLSSARESENATDTIYTLYNMGDLERSRSDFRAAISNYEEGLAIAKDQDRKMEQALMLNGISLARQYLAELDEADKAATEALEICRASGDRRGEAASLHQLGIIKLHGGDVNSAIESFKESLEIKKLIGDNTTGATLAELGRAYYFRGDYGKSKKYYRDAIEAGMPLAEEITVSNNLAMVFKMQGMLDYALETFNESLDKARARDMQYQVATLLNNIGVTLREKGEYDEALTRHEEALDLNKKLGMKLDELISMNNMALALKMKGEPEKALELLKVALVDARAVNSFDDLVRTLVNTGDVYMEMNLPEDAIKFYQEAADTAEKILSRERLWNALYGKGEALKLKGDTDGAVAEYKHAVKVIESLREDIGGTSDDKSYFLADKVKVYRSLITQLYIKGDFGEALDYLERMKSRSLLEMMRQGKADMNRDMTPEEILEEKTHKAAVATAAKLLARAIAASGPDSTETAAAKTNLERVRKERDAHQETLFAKYPGLAFARGESEPLNHIEIMKLLQPGEAVIAYMLTPETSYAWVMTSQSITMTDLETPEEKIDFQVDKKLREAIEQRVWGSSQERAAKKLYSIIIEPLEKQLEGVTTAGILPDGRLYELPFYLLLDGEEKFLIDRFAVYYMPSLSVMAESRRIRASLNTEDRVLAFGNPTFDHSNLVQLPGTEDEVNKIAGIYGDMASAYFHEQALEERVKYSGSSYRIIHMATHGLLNNNNPMFSSIALSQISEQKEDGYFEAREISDIHLNAELVVMSACESGRGRLRPGEGILGLTRSFFSAGTPSVIASMWEVNDQATSFMMQEFYTRLGDHDPVEALRIAQMATRDQVDANPNMWAPFVLMGAGPEAPAATVQ